MLFILRYAVREMSLTIMLASYLAKASALSGVSDKHIRVVGTIYVYSTLASQLSRILSYLHTAD